MPCPMCLEKRADLLVTDRGDFLKMFGQRLRTLNELTCPDCKDPWVVVRSGPDHAWVHRSNGVVPPVAGSWAWSVSAPQGEGTRVGALLTLTRDGDALTGEVAHWAENDYDPTYRNGWVADVRGEWEFDHAWLTVQGKKLGLDGGASALFFAKTYSQLDEQGQPSEHLIISRREERIVQNDAHQTWRRPTPYDARPPWLSTPGA